MMREDYSLGIVSARYQYTVLIGIHVWRRVYVQAHSDLHFKLFLFRCAQP